MIRTLPAARRLSALGPWQVPHRRVPEVEKAREDDPGKSEYAPHA